MFILLFFFPFFVLLNRAVSRKKQSLFQIHIKKFYKLRYTVETFEFQVLTNSHV